MADSPLPTGASSAFAGNATYQSEIAAIEHAYQTSLADDQEALKDDFRNATYQRALMGKAEPQQLQANEQKANKGGLLESGINSTRRANILTNAAQKRSAVTQKLGQAEGTTARNEENLANNSVDKYGTAVANATERRKAEIESSEAHTTPTPAQTTTPGPTVPGSTTPISSLPTIVSSKAQPSSGGTGLVRNPANGESYRPVKINGKTYHEYPNRTGKDKLVLA